MAKMQNINTGSGNTAIGSVSQGDHTTVDGTAEVTQESVDRRLAVAEAAINDLGREYEKDHDEIHLVIAQLVALKEEVVSGRKDPGKASGILKTIRDNFSWAYPAIKDFVKAVWPAILVAIGT